MTHAEFRMKQAAMDEAGFLTHIRTIQVNKVKVKDVMAYQYKVKTVWRYKYEYEVILNGEIVKQTRSRKTAKEFLIEMYEAKTAFDLAHARLQKSLNKKGR